MENINTNSKIWRNKERFFILVIYKKKIESLSRIIVYHVIFLITYNKLIFIINFNILRFSY